MSVCRYEGRCTAEIAEVIFQRSIKRPGVSAWCLVEEPRRKDARQGERVPARALRIIRGVVHIIVVHAQAAQRRGD